MANQNKHNLTDDYLKFHQYALRKSPNPIHKPSRSLNPFYKKIDKLDDVTRYNSANFNVNTYQNYPNRQGTPIKSKRRKSTEGFKRSISPKVRLVRDLFGNQLNASSEKTRELFLRAVEAPIRTKTAQINVVSHGGGVSRAVMNDFHIRETNPGFARNALGGYYTR